MDSVAAIASNGNYVCIPSVPIFDEHDDKNGYFSRDRLQNLADNCNRRAATTGDLSPFGPGHTDDDGAEVNQPFIWGYLTNYHVGQFGPSRLTTLMADFWIKQKIRSVGPDGKLMLWYGPDLFLEYPRRSIELWPKDDVIDWVALLKRTPERDLGLLTFSKKNGKLRYSKDYAMASPTDDPRNFDPTAAPDADQVVDVVPDDAPPPGGSDADGGDDPIPGDGDADGDGDMTPPVDGDGDGDETPLSPEDQATAEKYAKHVFGMGHKDAGTIMRYMKSKYGAECGINGDPARYDAGSAGSVANATNSFIPGDDDDEQVQRMRKRQNDVNNDVTKARYSKQLAAQDARIAALEAENKKLQSEKMHAEWEAELSHMATQFPIDASAELAECKKKRYSRAQFTERMEIIKRYSKASPVNLPRVETMIPRVESSDVSREVEGVSHSAIKSHATQRGIGYDAAKKELIAAKS